MPGLVPITIKAQGGTISTTAQKSQGSSFREMIHRRKRGRIRKPKLLSEDETA
jgi:hypothetical protein